MTIKVSSPVTFIDIADCIFAKCEIVVPMLVIVHFTARKDRVFWAPLDYELTQLHGFSQARVS